MELQTKNNNCWLLICLASLLFLTGCSGGKSDEPKTVSVSGTVMYKDQPVEGATVSFMAEGASQAASGVTDKEGKFQLSTYQPKDGAVIGEHVVTITKMEAGAAGSKEADDALLSDPSKLAAQFVEEKDSPKSAGPKSLLPEKYSNASSTPIKKSVTEAGPNSFVFNLTD